MNDQENMLIIDVFLTHVFHLHLPRHQDGRKVQMTATRCYLVSLDCHYLMSKLAGRENGYIEHSIP